MTSYVNDENKMYYIVCRKIDYIINYFKFQKIPYVFKKILIILFKWDKYICLILYYASI